MGWTHWVLLLTSMGGLAAGLSLCIWGWFPRRTGVTPFCRKCGYNLTGTDLTSGGARCPECGSDLNSERVVVGARHVRRGYIRAGLMLGAVGLLGIGTVVASRWGLVNWYAYAPTWWVLRDARSSDADRARRAFGELAARLNARSLNARYYPEVIETCLAEQPRARLPSTPADILATLYAVRALSETQQRQFFESMVQLRLRAASAVVGETPLSLRLVQRWTGPTRGFCTDVEATSLSQDGRPLTESAEAWIHGHISATSMLWWSSGASRTTGELGAHELQTLARVRLHEGEDPNDASTVRHTYERVLRASFQVLERAPEVDSHAASYTEALRALVQVSVRRVPPTHGQDTAIEFRFGPNLPMNLACQVSLVAGDASYDTGFVVARKNQAGTCLSSHSARLGHLPVDRVDVLLRPSAEAAATTWDIDEFWGGELLLHDIPVIGEPVGPPP